MNTAVNPRVALAELMAATIADHHNWTYEEVRPLAVPPSWKPGQHVIADCSKGVQYLCRWADAPDPMGNGFGPWGNSSTLWAHLHHLATPDELLIGDIVTFGVNGSEHATMVKEAGHDPLLWSDGSRVAPDEYRLSQDRRPSQYLRLPVPPVHVTPDDRLRAETGYWAWVQWKLGEGDWRDHRPAGKHVRPDVPTVIPPAWWINLARFVSARSNGNPPKPPHGI